MESQKKRIESIKAEVRNGFFPMVILLLLIFNGTHGQVES